MAKYIKTRKGNDGFYYPYTSPDLVIDENGKSTTTKFSEINMQLENIGQSTQEQINTAIDKAIEEGKMHSDASKLSIIDENNNFTSDNVEGALEDLSTQVKDIVNGLKLVAGENNTVKLMLGTEELSSITISGGIVKPTPVTYSITNTLSNCSNSNTATSIEENTSYTATITPSTNYKMSNIIITMGETDITASVVSGNNINIESVTGDIVITASAEVDTDAVVGSINTANEINITGLNVGTYTLKYEDDNGVLDDFSVITTMEVV